MTMAGVKAPRDRTGLLQLLAALPAADRGAMARARARQAELTKPPGSLGRLEDLAVWLHGWRGSTPRLDRVKVVVFAGWHGSTRHGISAYPAEVTGQMVANFESGGAAINQLCRSVGAELAVVALRPGEPTGDMLTAPAMDEPAMLEALASGFGAVDPALDLVAFGEMGIGNTTAAAALCAALFGGGGADWAGPGTGLDARGVAHKARFIDEVLERHPAARNDPWAALAALGGRELAAIAGAALAARLYRVPVLLDGFVATAAAAVLARVQDDALAHCCAAHRSAEPGHDRLLARLGLEPLLDLRMRLGEGSGAALAIALVRAALACHVGMATFAAAGVAGASTSTR
jgi:nicotinate-nucleotide--dimethylbenzimidazole phosphoribosyltransferase